MGWQPGGQKLPAGAVESGEKGDLPFAASFFPGGIWFFWPGTINLRGDGAFVFRCFDGLFGGLFFSRISTTGTSLVTVPVRIRFGLEIS